MKILQNIKYLLKKRLARSKKLKKIKSFLKDKFNIKDNVYLFEINDVKGVWDGRGYNGELLADGVYFFVMEAVGELGISHVEEGTITLIIK